jgi:hypothetical protein
MLFCTMILLLGAAVLFSRTGDVYPWQVKTGLVPILFGAAVIVYVLTHEAREARPESSSPVAISLAICAFLLARFLAIFGALGIH